MISLSGTWKPVVCETVSDVIEALKKLPSDLPVRGGLSGEGVALSVYLNDGDALHFEDPDEADMDSWDGDDEDEDEDEDDTDA